MMTEDSLKDRCLRNKRRHSYKDDGIDDDEIYGQRNFDLQLKLDSYPDDDSFYREMKGSDVTLAYFQENGFTTPILVKEKTGLGMRMPSENFTVSDVKKCVGSWRLVDVMDVTTQKDLEMTMKEWVDYYENTNRDRLLNVISLEFSHTKLENYVDQPAVVHDLDWVDLAWPNYLKEMQISATNQLDIMKYPKVQKYCLMSVAGCYTDFHIDMGGTSVWYHILRGKKVFWFIEPTEENLRLYENWTLSAKQSDVFFGDLVRNCHRITLEAGNTFFIPTGWIHAVYTPCDSLVFGGNFLHSFSIQVQLRIWEVETKTHVPLKFRYPFFTELHWYVLERYLYALSGRQYCHKLENFVKEEIEMNVSVDGVMKEFTDYDNKDQIRDSSKTFSPTSKLEINHKKFLTNYEIKGLEVIITWLQSLPQSKRNVPKEIFSPEELLSDLKSLLGYKELNNHHKAITGVPLLERVVLKKPKKYTLAGSKNSGGNRPVTRPTGSSICGSVWNYRRVRCKQCEPCTRNDCVECYACVDMKKFGGPGTLKKPCLSRQCMQPVLPATAVCFTCKKQAESKSCIEPGTGLLECTICFEVHHRECLQSQLGDQMTHQGCVDEDFPNSWECARCCSQGKQGQGRVRFRPPTLPPGEGRRKTSKKHEVSINDKDDDDDEIKPEEDSCTLPVSKRRKLRSSSDGRELYDSAVEKTKLDVELPLDEMRRINQSMVLLTRIKTDGDSNHSQETAKNEEDADDGVIDHSYSSKMGNEKSAESFQTTDLSRTSLAITTKDASIKSSPSVHVKNNGGSVLKSKKNYELVDDESDLGESLNESFEMSKQSAQKLSSRGRKISKPHRYDD